MRSRDGAQTVTYTPRLRLSADGAALDLVMPPLAGPVTLHRCARHADAD